MLQVSSSGFYDWVGRGPSQRDLANEELSTKIREVFVLSNGTYGMPRIRAELLGMGIRASCKRIARLMRQGQMHAVSRRRKRGKSHQTQPRQRRAPDLVKRQFMAQNINQLWVADMTYIPTKAGFLYLAVVIDVYSRKVVGWAFEQNMTTELVIAALNMALQTRRPEESVIHHSDQGSQYSSMAFGDRCREMSVRPSMGSVGDAYDNAMAESFFATLECELIAQSDWDNQTQARMAVFTWIEAWYNPKRRHSGLQYMSPNNFERKHYQDQQNQSKSTRVTNL